MGTRFEGTPVNVQIEGDGRQYLPQALQLMDTVLRQKSIYDTPMMKGHITLGDGAYAYAIAAGNVNVVRVVGEQRPERKDELSVLTKYPDFYSGVVTDGRITETPDGKTEVCAGFWPTIDCARLFDLEPVVQQVTKLEVEPWVAFPELMAPDLAKYRYTQYELLKPTMYSGQMRKLVQLLMGFGKQAEKSIYDDAAPGHTVPDSDDPDPSTPDPAAQVSKYEKEVKVSGRQVRYDYRFMRTHGLMRASDASWWLVEISAQNGVVAMKLPTFDSTNTTEFDQILIDLADNAGIKAIEEFGAYPTGESFPSPIAPWIKAGKVIRLAEKATLDGFYANLFYGSACGWAFNSDGSEAHNTAYNYGDDGIQNGVWWEVKLHLTVDESFVTDPRATEVKGMFASMKDDTDKVDTFDANMFKIDRLTAEQIDSVLGVAADLDAAYALLDSLDGTPLATGTAPARLVESGKLWTYPARLPPPYQIKFPEPLVGYVLSHDLRPTLGWGGENPPSQGPLCDTVMFVFFGADDELKYIKYFSDTANSTSAIDVEDDGADEPCKYVGTWTKTTRSGQRGTPNSFYTSDFDDRAEYSESVSVEVLTSWDMGFSRVVYGDDPDDIRYCFIDRYKRFGQKRETTIDTGAAVWTACIVPFFDREAYYYAAGDWKTRHNHSITYGYVYLHDPNHASGYRRIVSTVGYGPDKIPECGNPSMRRVWHLLYDPYECSDYADEGEWLHKCDIMEYLAYSIPEPPTPPFENTTEEAKLDARAYLVTSSSFAQLLTWEWHRSGPYQPIPLWFVASPDEWGNYQYIAETNNAFGDSDCIAYMDYPNTGPHEVKGYPNLPEMIDRGNPTFVGVV